MGWRRLTTFEYFLTGAIFEHLFRQHQKLCKTQIDLSPGDLLHYGGVEWLNIADFLGKIKKGLELHAMCFVFRTAVVFLCKERLRHKKKLMVRHARLQKYIRLPTTQIYIFLSLAPPLIFRLHWVRQNCDDDDYHRHHFIRLHQKKRDDNDVLLPFLLYLPLTCLHRKKNV